MALRSLHFCQKCAVFLGVRKFYTDLQQRGIFLCSLTAQRSSMSQQHLLFTVTPAVVWSRPKYGLTDTWKTRTCRFSDINAPPSMESRGLPHTTKQNCMVQPTKPKELPVSEVSLSASPASLWDLDGVPDVSPFEDISEEEAVQIHVERPLPPVSISLRDYVDQSETLQNLIMLGVDLSKLEKRPNVGSMLLRLDFETDVKDRILFLKDVGVQDSQHGALITRNPFFLAQSLENLKARVAYLKSKKFSQQCIAAMVSKAPYLLNFSVERLDNRLCFYQQTLGLNAEKTRNLLSRLPRLLCGSLEPVKENLKVFEQELGFRTNEIRHIVTVVPKALTMNKTKLTQVFDYIHNTMGIPHSLIVRFPQVVNSKVLRIKERHLFLHYLGRAQYDPSQPNYVSLDRLVSLPDEVFCSEVALVGLKDYELFQKTL